jgi:hypothetical protein
MNLLDERIDQDQGAGWRMGEFPPNRLSVVLGRYFFQFAR